MCAHVCVPARRIEVQAVREKERDGPLGERDKGRDGERKIRETEAEKESRKVGERDEEREAE